MKSVIFRKISRTTGQMLSEISQTQEDKDSLHLRKKVSVFSLVDFMVEQQFLENGKERGSMHKMRTDFISVPCIH
jgi:hypothetical protein